MLFRTTVFINTPLRRFEAISSPDITDETGTN